MTLYTRLLSYLRPHLGALAAAGAATFAFAALDASAYVLADSTESVPVPSVEARVGGAVRELLAGNSRPRGL